jgi:hypothetical protein
LAESSLQFAKGSWQKALSNLQNGVGKKNAKSNLQKNIKLNNALSN